MTTSTATFLETLFEDCDQFIEFRLIPVDNSPVEQQWFKVHELSRALDWLRPWDGQVNVYFGACPRIKRAGDAKAVTQARALWADVDAKDFSGSKEGALAAIRAYPLPPSITVDSGHGYQCYWLLKEWADLSDPKERTRFRATLKGIQLKLGADPSAVDVARVLRVPGFLNVKREPFVRAQVVSYDC